MKRVLVAGLGLLALTGLVATAQAADLPRPYQPPVAAPMYAPAFSWTGAYVGINGGWGWGTSNWSGTPTGNFDVSGGMIGGTIGYNWQTGAMVFGLEADLDWADINGTTTTACPAGCTTTSNWLGTVRGRLGFAANNFMPYVTGGVAFGDIDATGPAVAGGRSTQVGWTLGAGVEVALNQQWSVKGEYLYVDLGSFNCGLSCGAAVTNNVHFDTSLVRAGVNYRF